MRLSRRPQHFDFKPPRTEDADGVWASVAACMRNYLILRAKAQAFRADPEVEQALADARVDQLFTPTLAEGETLESLRGEPFDPEAAARRGMEFERLDQGPAPRSQVRSHYRCGGSPRPQRGVEGPGWGALVWLTMVSPCALSRRLALAPIGQRPPHAARLRLVVREDLAVSHIGQRLGHLVCVDGGSEH